MSNAASSELVWGVGSMGPTIREIAGQLALRGFLPGIVDGIPGKIDSSFGPRMLQSVKEFHSSYSETISDQISLRQVTDVELRFTLPPASDDRRHGVILAAAAEVGYPRKAAKYWDLVCTTKPPYPRHWCGGFALWACHRGRLGRSIKWKPGKGFLAAYLGAESITGNPQPGDICYFSKAQHHAVFVRRQGNRIVTIDGNQGANGDVIGINVRPFDQPLAYYSIRKFLDGSIP